MALYKRGKTWWMNFWFDGQRIQRSTKIANKRDAEEYERAYRTQLAKAEVGIEPKKPIPGFRQAMDEFLAASKVEHSEKPNTHRRYEIASIPLLDFFRDKRVDQVLPSDVEKYKSWRIEQVCKPRGPKPKKPTIRPKNARPPKKIAPATVNRELACLKKLLNRLVREDVLRSNPVSKVKLFAENNQQLRVLTYSEEKIYLMACSQPLRDYALLLLETGMRPGEALSLQLSHVFLDQNQLQVVKGKTKAARRTIWLTQRAKDVLSRRIASAKGEYVFGSPRVPDANKPVVKLNNAHAGSLRRSKLPHFRLHDLRHTFATRQVESGTDLVTLAALLGHSRLEMVMRYAHPSDSHKIEAMTRLELHRENQTTKARSATA
jgi:integrase